MDEQTTNAQCSFDYAWLDKAENNLLGAIEHLHGVCFMILEEYLKSSILNHGDLCCKCKEVHRSTEIDITRERKRYKTRFSSTVETWKDKFFKLRKRYKKLKNKSHKLKRNSFDENVVYVSDDSQNNQDSTSDYKEDVTSDEVGTPEMLLPDDRRNNNIPLPKDEVPNIFVANVDNCAMNGNEIDSCISPGSLQTNHSGVMALHHLHENSAAEDNNIQLKEAEVDKKDNKEGIENADELSLSWKRANRPPNHGRHNSKVRYLDGSRTLSFNKSIHEFFRPRSVCNIRSISSRRSKRQDMDSNGDLPRTKRLKEENKKPTFQTDSSFKLIESVVEAEDCIDSCCIDPTNEPNVERGSSKSPKDLVCLGNRIKEGPRTSKEKVDFVNITDKQSIDEKPTATSTASYVSRHKGKPSSKRGKMDTSHDVAHWRLNEVVGLPSSASTPMVNMEEGQPCQPNIKDLEDTMWSAPESPSVVRSMFSTPEKLEGDKSGEVEEEGLQHDGGHCEAPKRDWKQQFLAESQSFKAEMAYFSNKSLNKNHTCKTSDGDLSADMFFGNTENIDNTQDETIEKENIDKEIEPHIVNIVPEQKMGVEPALDNSYCFERPKADVKFKFSAVVRKRDERDKLDGYACAECAAWYEDEKDQEEKRKHLRKVCRHKAVSSPPPSTPDGFWSPRFPDTPVYMKRGLMLNEDDTLPLHARPKKRKDRKGKARKREVQNSGSE